VSDYPPLSPQVLGQAESALGALLAPLLNEAGLTAPQWFVLATAAARPGGVTRPVLAAAVTAARKVPAAQVAAAVTELTESGALAAGDPVTLTAAGRARHARVQDRLTGFAARLFDFPPDELATAGRVIGLVTARANALLADAAR
jgi:hypothetical protein